MLDDPVYNEKYMAYQAQASESFDATALTARIEALAEMLQPFIVAGEEAQFETAVSQLIAAVTERDTTVAYFVAAQ